MSSKGHSRAAGLTLIELLVSMGLFVALGLMMVQMVRGGLNLWRTGERQREVFERAQIVIEQLSYDLRLVSNASDRDSRIRFLADVMPSGEHFRMRWVRSFPEERSERALRTAAAKTAEQTTFRQGMGQGQIGEAGLLPGGGLAEVAYAALPGTAARALPGDLELYRGLVAPPGRPDGFFAKEAFASPEAVMASCDVLADGLLYFECLFAGQNTRSLAEDRLEGAESYWDSTRSSLPAEMFSLSAEPPIAGDPTYDVFPSRVRITLVFDEGVDARTPVRRLIGSDAQSLDVDDARKLGPLRSGDLLKVGEEWVRIAGIAGDRIALSARGLRGTKAKSHDRGAPVRAGRSFVRVFDIPMGREAFQ